MGASEPDARLRYTETWYVLFGSTLMPQNPLLAMPETAESAEPPAEELMCIATGLVGPNGASDTSDSRVPEPTGVQATGTSSILHKLEFLEYMCGPGQTCPQKELHVMHCTSTHPSGDTSKSHCAGSFGRFDRMGRP